MKSRYFILLFASILLSCKTGNPVSSLTSEQNTIYKQLLISGNHVNDYRTGDQVYYLQQDLTLSKIPQYILKRGYHGYKLIKSGSDECHLIIVIYIKDRNQIFNYQTCEGTQVASDSFGDRENRTIKFEDGTSLEFNRINETTYAVEQQGKMVARLTRERVGMEKTDGSYRLGTWRADFYVAKKQSIIDVIIMAFWQINRPTL